MSTKKNEVATTKADFSLSMVAPENLSNIFASDAFKEEGILIENDNIILKAEDWDNLEDQEINIVYFKDETFVGENKEDVKCVSFYSDFDKKNNTENKPYTAAQSVLVSRLQNTGFGLYKITFIGEKKSSKNKSHKYLDFAVKLIRKIN